MKISVSSYSFSQYINAGKMTQKDCVKEAKELGFDAVEFIDINGATYEEQVENAAEIRSIADSLGIKINAYTIGANLYNGDCEKDKAEVERLKKQLDIAKILGADVLRHDVCYTLSQTGNGRSFDLMLPTIAENARKITEYAQTLGIVTCSENHGFIAQDSDRVERLFNAVAHENFRLLVDIGNFLCVDENPITAVSRVAPYAVHAHAKDFYKTDFPTPRTGIATRGGSYIGGAVIGEGIVPVKRCLQILKNAGYDGYVSLEYESDEDCISGITRGLNNLRNIIDTLN